MRCVHKVQKRRGPWSKVVECRHRLVRIDSRLILGGHRWHVYRCRRGHETRILVKP